MGEVWLNLSGIRTSISKSVACLQLIKPIQGSRQLGEPRSAKLVIFPGDFKHEGQFTALTELIRYTCGKFFGLMIIVAAHLDTTCSLYSLR